MKESPITRLRITLENCQPKSLKKSIHECGTFPQSSLLSTKIHGPEKVRLVWDVAAVAHGVSMNSKLLAGPDELSSVPAVLVLLVQLR